MDKLAPQVVDLKEFNGCGGTQPPIPNKKPVGASWSTLTAVAASHENGYERGKIELNPSRENDNVRILPI